MEQVSPVFRWLSRALPQVELFGSEYLGPDVLPGEERDGLRNEDAERLTFEDSSLDLFVSCDVFEHVSTPTRAFQEMARVLKPNGRALLTFPMDPHLDHNVVRARLKSGELEHLAEPKYHGNPLSEKGSLVVTDFGWEVLSQLGSAGVSRPCLVSYWSYERGYLGIQFYFEGHKQS